MNAEKNNLTYIAYEKSPHMEEAPGRTSLPPSLLSFFKPVLLLSNLPTILLPLPHLQDFSGSKE